MAQGNPTTEAAGVQDSGQTGEAVGTPIAKSGPPEATPAIDLTAITKTVTEHVQAVLKAQLEELATNQRTLAETLAKAPPASPEEVTKLVREQLEAASKAQADQARASEARAAKVAELVKTRLGGNAELATLITASDDAGIEQQAEAIAAVARKLRPDFGAAASASPTTTNDRSFRALLR